MGGHETIMILNVWIDMVKIIDFGVKSLSNLQNLTPSFLGDKIYLLFKTKDFSS